MSCPSCVTAVLLAALTWDAANPVGLWTFTVLWLMRWSAKLNVFLGVPNLNGDWLPAHLGFLQSYMGRRSMNHLFPLSVTTATVAAVLVTLEALAADTERTAPRVSAWSRYCSSWRCWSIGFWCCRSRTKPSGAGHSSLAIALGRTGADRSCPAAIACRPDDDQGRTETGPVEAIGRRPEDG